MKFLQLNTDRIRVAHDLLMQKARSLEVDIIMAYEPNKRILKVKPWFSDKRNDVCILTDQRDVGVQGWGCGDGYV